MTATPITKWWARALAGPWSDPVGEVLIVLGADSPNGGVIGQTTYWRTVYAYRAWQQGRFKLIVVSGGAEVANSMKELLVCKGVPEAAIRTESQSLSTRENALFARALVEGYPGPKVLLTSDYHMYRARRAFQVAGVDVLPRPFPDVLKHANHWEHRWNAFLTLVLETVKTAGYGVRGWI